MDDVDPLSPAKHRARIGHQLPQVAGSESSRSLVAGRCGVEVIDLDALSQFEIGRQMRHEGRDPARGRRSLADYQDARSAPGR